jgi:hypothetical protein
MKKLLIGLTAFMCLSFTTNTKLDHNPVSDDNILYLYGETHDGTIIQIFAESYDGSYLLNAEFDLQEDYLVELNPTVSYQLWLTNPYGNRTVIFVEKGKSGTYYRQLDIPFNTNNLEFLHMHQEKDVYYLAFTN